ncbi:MAG: GyrI-like domain-containing protein [Bacteroidota bacterium]
MNNKPTPKITHSPKLQLAGYYQPMSLYADQTVQLWTRFMTLFVKETYRLGPNRYNVHVYPTDYFTNFDPSKEFIKWAAAEHRGDVPPTLEELEIPEGSYAVFIHKGPAATVFKTFEYIFNEWLPASDYRVDQRPHFDVMGPDYQKDSDTAEEELWVPVTLKNA